MKIVVIGGSGLIGRSSWTGCARRAMRWWRRRPTRASTRITGEGLAEALAGAAGRRRRGELAVVRGQGGAGVLRDVGPQPARRGSGRRREASRRAVGRRHRAPAGERLLRAKMAQEKLIKASGIPYTIVRATQFFEFVGAHRAVGRRGRRDPPVAGADAADRVGRRRRRAGRRRGGAAGERHDRGGRPRADPARRARPAVSGREGRQPQGDRRRARALLRRRAERPVADPRRATRASARPASKTGSAARRPPPSPRSTWHQRGTPYLDGDI